MATVPQSSAHEDEAPYPLPADHHLPGWTVDALLAENKVEEARAEFERLLDEGLDSGDAVEMTEEDWDAFRAELHREAKLES